MTSYPPDISTLRGKQRELYERDERVMQLAQQIFLEEGYHAVTIENLARVLGFARGTLYQRFRCKEILFLEVGIRCRRQVIELMEYASRIPGRPRERMVAIGQAITHYSQLYADNIRTIAVIDSEIVLDAVPSEQVDRLNEMDKIIFRTLHNVVQEAVEIGDLVLPEGATPASLCLALVALVYGWAQVSRRPALFQELGVNELVVDILLSAQRLMDGYRWQPLHKEWDYGQVYQRVEEALQDNTAWDSSAR